MRLQSVLQATEKPPQGLRADHVCPASRDITVFSVFPSLEPSTMVRPSLASARPLRVACGVERQYLQAAVPSWCGAVEAELPLLQQPHHDGLTGVV